MWLCLQVFEKLVNPILTKPKPVKKPPTPPQAEKATEAKEALGNGEQKPDGMEVD